MPLKNENWIAQWTCPPAEWRRFNRWLLARKGLKGLLLFIPRLLLSVRPAEVKIGMEEVYINKECHLLQAPGMRLLQINIFEAGDMNIMELRGEGKNRGYCIRIPVPRGKLKEAVMLEYRFRQVYAL